VNPVFGKIGRAIRDGAPLPNGVELFAVAFAKKEEVTLGEARWYALGVFTMAITNASTVAPDYDAAVRHANELLRKMAEGIEAQ
jgi:hypothetical protein